MKKEKFSQIKAIIFDFDGVFTDNKVYLSENGQESVICNRADGIGLEMLRKINIHMKIISTEPNKVVLKRAEKLKLLAINNVSNKLKELNKFSESLGIGMGNIAFVGNDINDLECMRRVGFPIAVNDAVDQIKKISIFILSKKGGDGAVREFCELVSSSYEE